MSALSASIRTALVMQAVDLLDGSSVEDITSGANEYVRGMVELIAQSTYDPATDGSDLDVVQGKIWGVIQNRAYANSTRV